MSKVKFKVRYNALLLREFTIADILRVTGLNPESVRTEIQRMKNEGFLVSQPLPGQHKKRGGRPYIYKVTDNFKARMDLSESIEAFLPTPPQEEPSSRYYLSAKRLIDQAMRSDNVTRTEFLSQAENDLDVAEKAEGGNLAPKIIKAHLGIQRGRLLYHKGQYNMAKECFAFMREEYTDVLGKADIKYIDEYLLCASARGGFPSNIESKFKDAEFARDLLAKVNEAPYQFDSPLVSLLIHLVSKLSETASAESLATLMPSLRASLVRIEASQLRIETVQQEMTSKVQDLESEYHKVQTPRPDSQQTKFVPQQQDTFELELSQAWVHMQTKKFDEKQ
jgi:hypothetical protein